MQAPSLELNTTSGRPSSADSRLCRRSSWLSAAALTTSRPRLTSPARAETTASFPSGHTIGAATLLLVAWYLVASRHPMHRHLLWWGIATVLGIGAVVAGAVLVTVEAALAHPTWSMGPKITVDSSTLMNKGLEVIEAHELYGTPYDDIDVVVHPQSIVHSMVEFTDGSTIAQLSLPDMRLPIGYALGYPDRIGSQFGRIDWTALSRLDFEAPDRAVFRCLDLAYDAGRLGGTAPAWLSAANEVAVDAFLSGNLRWNEIPDVCVGVLAMHDGATPNTVDDVIDADAQARRIARDLLSKRST